MRFGILPAVVAVAVVSALAGCGSPAAGPTSTSGTPGVGGDLAIPHSRLDLPCRTAVPDAALDGLLPERIDAPADLDGDPVASVYEVRQRQVGLQKCVWTGEDGQATVGFAALPDAALAFDSRSGTLVDVQYTRVDELGDRSEHQCSYGYCYADVLLGETWLSISAYRPDLMDELDLEPLFLEFARGVVASTRSAASASPREPWQSPDGVWRVLPGPCPEAGLIPALGDALAIPGLGVPATDGLSGFDAEVFARSGVMACDLVGDRIGYGSLAVVPGGLWALPELAEVADARYGGFDGVAGGVDGAPALVAAGPAGAAAFVALDGSLLYVAYDGMTRDELVAALPAVLEVVGEHAAA